MQGKVILVGAGPGGRELLTLRAAEVLQQAQVVVYDRLVSADVLEMIPEGTERIHVGKKSGDHPVPQDEIEEILIAQAKMGKLTVRLKGGDSYLFGRGGEEVQALAAQGIPFEVVPGITSALAVPAYAGIPVTHRSSASSLHIVTAHAKAGSGLHIDFESLVKMGGTIVFLMGVSSVPFLMDGLLQAGAAQDLPAAIVENGARPEQRKVIATVGSLAQEAERAKIESPAVIIVGQVCALSDELDWFSRLPLRGIHVVVTRPKARAGTLSAKLRALGARVTEYPCIEMQPPTQTEMMHTAVRDLKRFHWLVFTSAAGVDAFAQAIDAAGLDIRAAAHMKFAAIGSSTAAALRALGIRADFMPEKYDGQHLAAGLCEKLTPQDSVLLARAECGSAEVTEALKKHDIPFSDIAFYKTVYRSEKSESLAQEIVQGKVDYAAFTSASAVEGFVQSLPGVQMQNFTALCIGAQTAARAKSAGMRTITARNASIDDMIACLLEEKANG